MTHINQQQFNPVGLVFFGALLMGSLVIVIRKFSGARIVMSEYSKRRQAQDEEKRTEEQLTEITPMIVRFVESLLRSTRWPVAVSIASVDFGAFRTLIHRKTQLAIQLPLLVKRRTTELERQQQQQFTKAFWTLNSGLPEHPTLAQWVCAYVDSFGHSLEYVSYLQRLIADADRSLVPADGLANAIQSEVSRRTQLRRVEAIQRAMSADRTFRPMTASQTDAMGGTEFESFLSTLFSRMGYEVKTTPTTGDQGADLTLNRFGERTVVQAKRWNSPVSNAAVQEVDAAKAVYGCQRAIVVTNSTFTAAAKALAQVHEVDLWDRSTLDEMLRIYQ